MALFASRPEEPTEWGGLPSEPLAPESVAEKLDSAVDALGLVTGGGVASIVIPVASVAPVVKPDAQKPDA